MNVDFTLGMKNKGQILEGSHFSSKSSLKLSDIRCLVFRLNTTVDYRSVCTHAVALYIFRKSFTEILGLPFVVMRFLRNSKEKRDLSCYILVYFVFVSYKNVSIFTLPSFSKVKQRK